MYPKLFNLIDSYIAMMMLGCIIAFVLLVLYLKYVVKYSRNQILDTLIIATLAILIGIIFGILFENLYELLENPRNYQWTWGMTFYGGLLGGAGGFVLIYLLYGRKRDINIRDIIPIAPGCITIAHAFGRLGCFLEGCCYGKVTDSWIGVKFPFLTEKVVPTQLIEMTFLFLISIPLIILAFKKKFFYTFLIYLPSYAIFRFIIEFYRGDYRGGSFLHLYPSQWFAIVVLLLIPVVILVLKRMKKKNE